jgi:DNA replication protein DnaC
MVQHADKAEANAATDKGIRDAGRLIAETLCDGKVHDGVQSAVIRTLRDGGDHEAARAAGLAVLEREEEDRSRMKIDRTLKKIEEVFDKTFWPESFDLSKVKNPDTYREALDYFDQDNRGLGLWAYGSTGHGKSRLAVEYAVMAARRGMDVDFWIASDLKAHLAQLATTGEGDRRARIEHFIAQAALAEVLVLDDAFQTFSPSYAEHLRRLLDCFHGILIVTSNFSPKQAANLRFKETSPEILKAIVRRMAEKCTVFNFDLVRKARAR